MRIFYPHYRNERLKMIQDIFLTNGYKISISKISNTYKNKNSQCRFICKYRHNPNLLKGKGNAV